MSGIFWMPKDFDRCVKAGGRVRTKSLGGRKYVHICFKDGKSYRGHVKVRKTKLEGELSKKR